ncbi:hypothetical protein [Burkholderia phage FLC9]|nr:hypothetical protein [Burkholderia phage FLC9]
MEFHLIPKYRAHKVVEALKIAAVEGTANVGEAVTLTPADPRFGPFKVTHDWWLRNKPVAGTIEGGYWVRYDNGYQSWSPAKAFEDGYTLATDITPELLKNIRAVVAKDLVSDEEISKLNQMVMSELIDENRGVLGGPDVIHMQHPARLAEAVTEMVLNKLAAMA